MILKVWFILFIFCHLLDRVIEKREEGRGNGQQESPLHSLPLRKGAVNREQSTGNRLAFAADSRSHMMIKGDYGV
jgi:hypothetical protein